ncbi:hypothetical protein C8Q70DRAFT_167839 [Cubamyces menziesii]|nr:hypothetical protein C8Q70DRAFT_167839 [Cubamyces menziesii]
MQNAIALISWPSFITQKLSEYGHTGCPTGAILAHSAIDWWITHAGRNIVHECIVTRAVPIFCVAEGDKTVHAVHPPTHLGEAYKLLDVRHGVGLGPIFRMGHRPSGTVAAVSGAPRRPSRRVWPRGKSIARKVECTGGDVGECVVRGRHRTNGA